MALLIPTVPEELFHGHGRVVEQAEALAVIGEGVMEPAAQMNAKSVLERLLGGQNRPPDAQPGEGQELGEKGNSRAWCSSLDK